MTDTNLFGTLDVGRWNSYGDTNRGSWISVTNDPYSYVYYPGNLSIRVSAKERARELGVDYIFEMIDGRRGTMDDAKALADVCHNAQCDQGKYIEFYHDLIYNRDMLAAAASVNGAPPGHEAVVCIAPGCSHTTFIPDGTSGFLNRCSSCNSMTSIRAGEIDDVPEGPIFSLATQGIAQLVADARRNRDVFALAASSEHASITVENGFIELSINSEMPQLKIKNAHFIRGRVNRRVLSDTGINLPSTGRWYTNSVINMRIMTLDFLTRLLSDDDIILDLDMANDIRAEYIDERWGAEYDKFARAMSKRKIIKVDSAGLTEMLTALYNIVQNNIGKKPIIKKTGDVLFPTADVLNNISDRDIKIAFGVSEHEPFDNVDDVFYLMEDE